MWHRLPSVAGEPRIRWTNSKKRFDIEEDSRTEIEL